MVSVKKFNLKRILITIITVIFVFCAVSLTATKIIYDQIFRRYDQQPEIPTALQEMVESRQVCQFYSGENQLTGYYYSPKAPSDNSGLIIYVPGFSAGADDYLWQFQELTALGWGIFTFDTTGTLRSEGKNQVGFSQSVLDLESAIKYVEKNDRFGYSNLILMGHSRGAYAACCALAQPWDIDAVVSISGINSAMEGIMELSVSAVGPVSYGNYGFLWLYQAMLFGADTLDLEASRLISQRDVPVLVVHGTQDEMIPLDRCSIVSYKEEISSDQVEYLLCVAGHTDIIYDADGTANDMLIKNIHEFLTRSLAN